MAVVMINVHVMMISGFLYAINRGSRVSVLAINARPAMEYSVASR